VVRRPQERGRAREATAARSPSHAREREQDEEGAVLGAHDLPGHRYHHHHLRAAAATACAMRSMNGSIDVDFLEMGRMGVIPVDPTGN